MMFFVPFILACMTEFVDPTQGGKQCMVVPPQFMHTTEEACYVDLIENGVPYVRSRMFVHEARCIAVEANAMAF